MRDLVFLTRDQTQAVKYGVLTTGPGNFQHTDWEKIFAHHVSDKGVTIPNTLGVHTSTAKSRVIWLKNGQRIKEQTSQDHIQMAKNYSWLIIRELQIKPTMTYHLTLISMAIIRTTRSNKYLVRMQRNRKNHCVMLVGMQTGTTNMENSI